MKVVKVVINECGYTADATWLPGSPPVARNWSSQELAIAVLKDMIACDKSTNWGRWPEHYNVECENA